VIRILCYSILYYDMMLPFFDVFRWRVLMGGGEPKLSPVVGLGLLQLEVWLMPSGLLSSS
jgi:hypothetical protein